MQRKIAPVILSGGAGTRLWPHSLPEKPKQLQVLVGEQTMLQQTAIRVSDGAAFLPPIVVASASHADAVDGQLAAVDTPPAILLLEPCPRNTAGAVALAALGVDPDQLLLVMPSDHVIGDVSAFLRAVETGKAAAADGRLVTFGIRPDRPETGYGYIRRGRRLSEGLFEADGFIEKPNSETAESLLVDGGYHWNSGIFLFGAGEYLDALAEHAPDIFESTRRAMEGARRSDHRIAPEPKAFAETRAQSIDHAVMEHAARIAVVPVEMEWSDVGTWDALWAISGKNGDLNSMVGTVTAVDSHGCLLRSDGPRVMAIGVEDLIVIAASDSVLVMRRGDSQRLGEALKALGQRRE